MSREVDSASTPEQLVVSVEQANVLLDVLGETEAGGRVSSAALTSGLVESGYIGVNGLRGDAKRILEPAESGSVRVALRVVSPTGAMPVRDWRIWVASPRSVIMRSAPEAVHFSQVDACEVPHVLAMAALLHEGPTIHDGPPAIPTGFVQAIRALDIQGAQDTLNHLVTYGPAESHFARDCVAGRWSVVTCVREEKHRGKWRPRAHLECFVTEHLHALIHSPLDLQALSALRQHPTLDAPPRTMIWAMLLGLIGA